MRFRRRAQRSNLGKTQDRLLGSARVVYDPRKERFLAHAKALSDTEGNARSNYWKIQTLNLFARALGFQMVPNDRVFHFVEDHPGAVQEARSDEGPVGGALRHLEKQGLPLPTPRPVLDRHIAEGHEARMREAYPELFTPPLSRWKLKQLGKLWDKLKPETDAINLELAQRRRRDTISREKLNEQIAKLRDGTE